jgi:adenosylcobyric acid synthase
MVQGTASHAGKTTLVAALCRLFARAGYRVAPFKAQNMSNNAAVTLDGGEVGRAQAMQAMAAGIPVTVDMNPILLKPQSDRSSQIVVLGKARYRDDARRYYDRTDELWPVVTGALDRLRGSFDIVVAEGAGSPAEINLERYDIVNMRVARHANAPVLLVGDIDRGGVFASLYGTVALLPENDRALIRGFIINKFRGDPSLLDPGFTMLEERTGIPTLGVLPYADLSRVPVEDAVEWGARRGDQNRETTIDIAVMRLPRVANLDEFQPLMNEPDVSVRWIAEPAELGSPDLIIIPGTKSTMADLAWMRERGLDGAIQRAREADIPVFGICGGFQMLGDHLVDDEGVEQRGAVAGLGLLPVSTTFAGEKLTRRVLARLGGASALWSAADVPDELDAYEIHMGRTIARGAGPFPVPFVASHGGEEHADGCMSADGNVVGTYMHGLLENASLRRAMLAALARRKGRERSESTRPSTTDEAIDSLADLVRDNVDIGAIARMTGLSLSTAR